MGHRALAVVLGVAAVLGPAGAAGAASDGPPHAAGAERRAEREAADLGAAGDALRAERATLLARLATVGDGAEAAHAAALGAHQRLLAADEAAARARAALVDHAVGAFVHGATLPPGAQARSGVFAAAVADADRAVVIEVEVAARDAASGRAEADASLDAARRAEAELVALRGALEATITDNEVRTAAAEAEVARNAQARRLAEEEARVRAEATRAVEAAAARSSAPRAPAPVAVLPGTPTGESGGLAPVGGYTAGHLARFGRATAAQAALLAAHPFGPVAALPSGTTGTGVRLEGLASWYGPGFDGRPTASGALFDQQGWTVASKELPLGTVLLVTRGDRAALVLVNDRGPYVAGRFLDLSRAVATHLGTIGPGVAHVRAEVVRLP